MHFEAGGGGGGGVFSSRQLCLQKLNTFSPLAVIQVWFTKVLWFPHKSNQQLPFLLWFRTRFLFQCIFLCCSVFRVPQNNAPPFLLLCIAKEVYKKEERKNHCICGAEDSLKERV